MMAAPRSRPYKELNLQQLRSFCAVCRHSSYARAADELNLATPTVWEQLQGLQRYLAVPLLQRRGKSVRPTPAGEAFLDAIRPLLAGIDSVQEVVHEASGTSVKSITIISGPRILLEDLMGPLAQFAQRHSGTCLRLLHTGDESLDPAVERGEADFGVTLEPGPRLPASPGVTHERAYELEYLLVAPRRHPLTQRSRVSLEEIARYPLVVGRPEAYARHRLEEVFYCRGLLGSLKISVEASSDAFALGAVHAGMGVGIVAGQPRGLLCRGLWVRSLRQWFGTARFVFVWKRGAHRPAVLRELAELIRGRPAD